MIELNLVKFDTGLVAANNGDSITLNQITEGEFVNCKLDFIHQRSAEQLNLFWACCGVIADNTENINYNTKDKVYEQLRLKLGFIDYRISHHDPETGKLTTHYKTKSLSKSNCNHQEATQFINDAIKYMADVMKMTEEKFISEVKSQMCIKKITKEFKGAEIK